MKNSEDDSPTKRKGRLRTEMCQKAKLGLR